MNFVKAVGNPYRVGQMNVTTSSYIPSNLDLSRVLAGSGQYTAIYGLLRIARTLDWFARLLERRHKEFGADKD